VRPRADELGRVADGLRAMAAHLADAHERERSLERRLAHEQRLAALGRVVAGLAHEIRNPLAGLKLRLDIARRSTGVPAEVLAEVSGGIDEVARLDRLVASLLALGRPNVQRTRFDVGALIDERLRLLEPGAAHRKVVLRRIGTAVATADRDALARVLDNLARNAVEASPPGEVTASVTELTGGCRIDVRDAGPGLTSAVELFEPFSSSKPDGMGLGLFIARALLEAMGGTITYQRESAWTTFRVTLPTS
jgi:signal transduction histidine kinase